MKEWLLGTDCLERKQELVNTVLQMSHLEMYLHKKEGSLGIFILGFVSFAATHRGVFVMNTH